MNTALPDLTGDLTEHGLKVTPQGLAILQVIHSLNNHPTAKHILTEARKVKPQTATGTVYHALAMPVKHNVLKKLSTNRGMMHNAPVVPSHHHLYCNTCDRNEDYHDEEPDELLRNDF